MSIVDRAENWLADDGDCHYSKVGCVITAQIMRELLLEIKCLKVQVEDRGNSYQSKAKENEQLRTKLEAAIAEVGQLKQGMWQMKDTEIARWKDAYGNMKDFAITSGLDITCYGTAPVIIPGAVSRMVIEAVRP